MTISFFLVVGTIVSINGIGLNLSGTAFAQPAAPQANFTSVEQQQLMGSVIIIEEYSSNQKKGVIDKMP